MDKVVIITGAHNSGKTTFIEKVVSILSSEGVNVAYIKHDPKGKAKTDTEGKDSYRIYNAGAREVVIASPNKLSIFVKNDAYDINYIIEFLKLFNPDIVIVEGFKSATQYDKYEVIRKDENRELMLKDDPFLKGVITDYYKFDTTFDINNPITFVEFLKKKYLGR
ncbi:MAG: molybdopterin-guanine dinucleotide biosynthesis protein B [Hydrogenothermaceae bacterium]|nr:molybdopterin-guanine dinucleotide biosynthesis protein B [Hydrogenothermaceae bacterium]